MSFSDGKHLIHMPVVQDHKRAFEGDEGPNTGGMGSYTGANHLLPFMREEDIVQARSINEQTLQAIQEECGEEYKGVIYGGFMAVREGVRLVEYNARFGDPEVMNVLTLLQSDFVELTQAIIDRTLDTYAARFAPMASVCKYVVPEGYPDQPIKGKPIDVSAVDSQKVNLFFGAVDATEDGLMLQGSRAIGLVANAPTIAEAERIVEEQIIKIKGPVRHRKDIGTAKLIQARVEMMKHMRHA